MFSNVMKTAITALILVLLAASGYVGYRMFLESDAPPPDSAAEGTGTTTPSLPADNEPATNDSSLITRQPSSTDRQVYINQEWRFSFEYPDGWKIQDPVSQGKIDLLDIGLWPNAENAFFPVRVFLSPKWWVDRLKYGSSKEKRQTTTVAGYEGGFYPSVTMSVIPTMEYFVLLHNEYWVNISIQDEYADELGMVLDTFKFHNPPTLEEVGVEPYIPEYVQ
jgi:hypothetical protein